MDRNGQFIRAALKWLRSITLAIEQNPNLPGKHLLPPETNLGLTDEAVYHMLNGKTGKNITFVAVGTEAHHHHPRAARCTEIPWSGVPK